MSSVSGPQRWSLGSYHYQPGLKRYRCKEQACKRTFNDLTGTLWTAASALSCIGFSRRFCCACRVPLDALPERWGAYADGLSLVLVAAQRGPVVRDGAAISGTVKPTTSIIPLATRARLSGGKKSWAASHGAPQETRARAWPLRQGSARHHRVDQPPGRCRDPRDARLTVKTVQKAADLAVHAGSRLYTDSASSYRALKGYVHDFVNHTQKEYARGEVHENRAECLFSLLKPYLRVFRGISKTNLPGYVGFFQFLRNFHQLTAFEQAEMILYAALDPAVAGKARKGDFVRCLDHFNLLQTAR